MTRRSYAQHNTVVYQTEDKYRGIPHRNCILMNKNDVEKAGFEQHQRVKVKGNVGELEHVEIIFGDVREGAGVMFYPEVRYLKPKLKNVVGHQGLREFRCWFINNN